MCSWAERLRGFVTGALLALAAAAAPAQTVSSAIFPGIGRAALPAEVAAWDTDVRPDFKGLPAGSGSVAQGMVVWETKCESCHGIFGESNAVFTPLVGGTTAADVRTGRVARLTDPGYPGRTTLMKLATLSTLWDYIYRAMPWNAPKSLSVDETYAVTAYMLNLGRIVPDEFTLSHRNMAQTQALMPNRGGMTTAHGLWPGRSLGQGSRPDVQGTACMKDCAAQAKVASYLPEHARDAHGNLAEQQRLVGPQRGIDTSRTPAAATAQATTASVAPAGAGAAALALARQHNCLACHGVGNKIVGPALNDIARKYAGRGDAVSYLAQRIMDGSSGVWGSIPMPAQALPAADAQAIAQWLAQGAKK
jgi:S-disulfanyl-L-cysteine oxidoreductase SoxD